MQVVILRRQNPDSLKDTRQIIRCGVWVLHDVGVLSTFGVSNASYCESKTFAKTIAEESSVLSPHLRNWRALKIFPDLRIWKTFKDERTPDVAPAHLIVEKRVGEEP
jgi:hypothetical protein